MVKHTHIVFACILLLASFLRLYALAVVPPSPSLDEVSIGYNAFSILTTGKDEYGYRLPLLLRAYDDYRPALYVYLVVPFVKFMGLTPLSVRFPSIILSLISVYLLYCIGKLLSRYNSRLLYLGEAASFLLAISPWHIYISRLGHESNLGFTLTIAGVYASLLFMVEKKSWQLVWAAVWFGLSLHGYQSQKLVVPILLTTTALLYWKECMKEWKKFLIASVVFLILTIPALYVTFTGSGLSRLKGTSAFSQDAPILLQAFANFQIAKKDNDAVGMIINNRKVVLARIFISNYVSHFAPNWLFMGGTREAHKVPYLGLLYPWEAIGIIVGLVYMLIFSSIDIRILLVILVWGLSGPLPAAITTQAPHAMRAYTLLPVLSLIGGIGMLEIWYMFKKTLQWGRWIIALLFLSWSLLQFWNGYFIVFPITQSDSFQYALKDTMSFVVNANKSYKKTVIANNGNLYQSYMFYLFYTQFNPMHYQSLGGSISGGYDKPHTIENIEFRSINWSTEVLKADTLYVADSKDAPLRKRIVNVLRNLDGKEAIIVFTL